MTTDFSHFFSSLLAGMLHGLTGIDHLTAVLPLTINKGFVAWKIGFHWGLGHGIGLFLFGTFAYLLKSFVPLEMEFIKWQNIAVGLSLVIIGILGIREVQLQRFVVLSSF
eukprot:TRINITY_DN2778_c0_g1_i14.p1 TRINITY_DN2778_c0_g1~~TRINITY_DN2778_c0_g1_i14.p1  ORF type:complete len:110 (+),score=9.30 TRINITY_DN2778_c0_g1_i14:113-442(+)